MSHINKGDVHAYLDGALGAYPEEAARHIREHLNACRDCAQLLEDERRLRKEADAILAASAPEQVELDPLEELLARAAEPDRQERSEGAEGSERTRRARPLLGRRLRSLRWAAMVVVSLGAGWMARDLTGPAGDVARAPASEPVVSEIDSPPAADQQSADRERLERDNVGAFAEAEDLPAPPAAVARRLADADAQPPEQVAAVRGLAEAETPPESQVAAAVGGVRADRGAGASADDVVLDQVAAVPARQEAASDELRRSAVDQRGRALLIDNAAPEASAAASLSTTSFLVPGLPVLDVRLATEADGRAGGPSSVVVTQELEDGRVVELQFVPLAGSDAALKETLQERNDLLGRAQAADWGRVIRDVPGGLAVLSGPLTTGELAELLDRALGPR